MATFTFALAGFNRPFKVTFGSPMEGVLVIFKVSEFAPLADSIPITAKERESARLSNLFTNVFPTWYS